MDDIQKKLISIDHQLAGFADFYKRITTTCPLLFAATGLMAGILVQKTLPTSWDTIGRIPFIWLWLTPLALFTFFAIPLLIIQRGNDTTIYVSVLLSIFVFVGFVCLGAIRLITFHQPRPNDIRNFVHDEQKLATIRGLIITNPCIHKYQQWKFAKFIHNDPTSSFYLKLNEVKTINGWAKVTGTVRVQVNEPVLDQKAGDYIQTYCWLDRFKGVTNPGQFNTAKYLAQRNVFIAASIKSRDGIELLESHHIGHFTQVKRKLRETATQALLGDTPPDSPGEGLLQALLLGYRRNIDSATYETFRKTGLLHFISLSGMHLGIFVGIIWWLCKTAGLMKHARAMICIIAISVFLLIVPPRAPTVRAAIIAFAFCISFFFRRRPNSINTLSLAAIILLLIRPTQLFEAGWQLSFATVLGIVLFCERVHFFMYEKITGFSWFKKSPTTRPFFRIISRPGPYLLELFSTGLTAWLGGAGILLYHFYTINPLTTIWTVIVFPFVALILAFGYLKIILSLLLPTAALGLGVIVKGLAISLIWIVEHIARLDISQILIGHVPLALIILYYCLILFTAFVYFRRPLLKKAICTAAVLTIIVFLGVTKWQRTHRDGVILTCLDVGHGQAILAQLPGQVNILFDAGSLYIHDIGRRAVAPFFDYSGISKIDAIIISHNDVDHINGIPEIVEHCNVGQIYANDAFLSTSDTWGTAEYLRKDMREKGFDIESVGQALNFDSSTNIRILWPDETASQFTELSDNDSSLVCLIEFADRRILLCSDIEELAQAELLRLNPELRADIVVIPHHGSSKTLKQDFLENLGPEFLICSCSYSQYKRQDSNEVENYADAFYTARDGAINIRINKNGLVTANAFVRPN